LTAPQLGKWLETENQDQVDSSFEVYLPVSRWSSYLTMTNSFYFFNRKILAVTQSRNAFLGIMVKEVK
jgi:hypothetical protein